MPLSWEDAWEDLASSPLPSGAAAGDPGGEDTVSLSPLSLLTAG